MATQESFADLLQNDISSKRLRAGDIIKAIVISIEPEYVTVNAGLKSDALIPVTEFRSEPLAEGDTVEVVIETFENGFGETRLSHEKARQAKAWLDLQAYHDNAEVIQGKILERVKGGFTVDLGAIRAFLPGSLVDVKPVRDIGSLEGETLDFKIIKMDQKRNNIVVSRRAVLELETNADRQARLDELQEDQEIIGVVKNITDYGAFVDLGGIDGLLHITDMSWKRIRHPSDLVSVGDEVKVRILKFDREKNRVSLGLKQLGHDPWVNVGQLYPPNTRLTGHVTNITDYGCFVQLREGVEGLVHMSEMDWTNKNIHPSKIVKQGDEVEVIVLEIDEERRRISLGIKQCQLNPWDAFAKEHGANETVKGFVRSITDFGLFLGLEGGIDGLVHMSDLSWTESGENAVRQYQKGQEVEAIILTMDPERERISLGIKQLTENAVQVYCDEKGAYATVTGKVVEIEERQAILLLEEARDIRGILRIADYDVTHTKDLQQVLSTGDAVEVKLMNYDSKLNQLFVSRKALLEGDTPLPETGSSSAKVEKPTKRTLGDLLREQMKDKKTDN